MRHRLSHLAANMNLAPYAAEAGRAVFTANAAVALFVLATEFLRPGFSVQTVSPMIFVGIGVASGAASLLAPAPPRSWFAVVLGGLLSVAAVALASLAAWRYFATVPEAQLAISIIVGATVAYALAIFSSRPRDL